MSVRGPYNVGRAVQTDLTLLCYSSAITEQKNCWELLAEKFDWFQTLRNNMQQVVETDATCNIQQCWELLVNNVASFCTQPERGTICQKKVCEGGSFSVKRVGVGPRVGASRYKTGLK